MSPATRFDALDKKTTYRPLPLIAGGTLSPFAWVLGHADSRRLARLPVVHEDVARAVRVAGDEVRGVRVDAT